jgi:hypothetical protein
LKQQLLVPANARTNVQMIFMQRMVTIMTQPVLLLKLKHNKVALERTGYIPLIMLPLSVNAHKYAKRLKRNMVNKLCREKQTH